METVNFITELGEDNYSCYSDKVPGLVATGKTLEELKNNAQKALAFHLEGLRIFDEPIPDILQGAYTLSFTFDIQMLLSHYNKFFTKAALSKLTGIGEKQLEYYMQGVHKPRADHVKKIKKALRDVGKKLPSMALSLD